MHTIERYHDISCGHRVTGHEGACAKLHGHNYRITFVCAATPTRIEQHLGITEPGLDKIGRVLDFSAVKRLLCMWLESNWDHRFLLFTDDPMREALCLLEPESIVIVPFNPTAENMAQYLVETVAPKALLGTGVQLISCKVEETRKCSATYHLPQRAV